MVVPCTMGVHAEDGDPSVEAGSIIVFPSLGRFRGRAGHYICGMTCAQIAIIPTKSTTDVSAAASSTNVFNMTELPIDALSTIRYDSMRT